VRSVAYDHFYAYDELTDTLRTWSEEAPNLCALESIGKSYEGRDIWLVTVTNTETGAHLDKPGFLIEANIHSMEWTGARPRSTSSTGCSSDTARTTSSRGHWIRVSSTSSRG